MRLPRKPVGAGGSAVCLLLTAATIGSFTVPACGEALPTVKVCPKAPLSGARVVQVETVLDEDTVFTKINSDINTRIPVTPVVASPLDDTKLEISNRINSGLLTGQLTNEEADELRDRLQALSYDEARFKLAYNGQLSAPVINNLMRKYQMISQRADELMNNSNVTPYMLSVDARRQGLQRRIQYHLAAGDLTAGEAEQLLTALATISDDYASALATGNTLGAAELEGFHRDLSELYAKLSERCGATIAFVSPATHDKLAAFKCTIDQAFASNQFSSEERDRMVKQYNDLSIQQDAIVADSGVHAPDLALLAKHIDNLNFILTRELRDRQLAGRSSAM